MTATPENWFHRRRTSYLPGAAGGCHHVTPSLAPHPRLSLRAFSCLDLKHNLWGIEIAFEFGTQGRSRKGQKSLNLRIVSFAGNSERHSLVRCKMTADRIGIDTRVDLFFHEDRSTSDKQNSERVYEFRDTRARGQGRAAICRRTCARGRGD
ncbi:hypothetical protein EVAR_79958_1 [Eumeta japonica]|uniref:Uncharacterized protein n=1 Tax=Eumeta variegata TaxID=151549 RepID=A0A4C1Y306_EUMVA|nr:hypothetical protein EVAR_79958_1 [Eumeta japonica]